MTVFRHDDVPESPAWPAWCFWLAVSGLALVVLAGVVVGGLLWRVA